MLNGHIISYADHMLYTDMYTISYTNDFLLCNTRPDKTKDLISTPLFASGDCSLPCLRRPFPPAEEAPQGPAAPPAQLTPAWRLFLPDEAVVSRGASRHLMDSCTH